MLIAANRKCVVLSWDSIYKRNALCNKKRKICKRTSMIPYVRWHMQFSNTTKWIASCSDCKSIFTTWVIQFWMQTSRQAFPRKIGQKVRQVSETHGFCNVTYATTTSHTMYVESWFSAKIPYAVCVMQIRQNNGKHINVRAWFYMRDCVCDKTNYWNRNFTTWS